MDDSGYVDHMLVGVLAGRDVVLDVLDNQLLKALHKNRGECHRAVDIKISHCRLFRSRDDGGRLAYITQHALAFALHVI